MLSEQGVVTRSQAQYALGHVISTAAMDNETELRSTGWQTDRVERWKEEIP